MRCPRCNGRGEYMREIGGYRPCEYCDGTGEIVQTNEEWFCGLSIEEKMTWAAQEQGTFTAKGWTKWLKEKHE